MKTHNELYEWEIRDMEWGLLGIQLFCLLLVWLMICFYRERKFKKAIQARANHPSMRRRMK